MKLTRYSPLLSLILLLACMLALFMLVPWESFRWTIESIEELSVDAAFVLALPALFQSGAQYGSDVVFTYGPWGLLASPIVPSNIYPIFVVINSVIVIAVISIGFTVVMKSKVSLVVRLILFLGFLGLITLWVGGLDQGFWFFPSLYLGLYQVFHSEEKRPRVQLILALVAAVAAAWVGLVKFNVFVLGLSIQIIILVLDLSFRRLPYIFAVWVGTTAIAWVAAGQQISHLPIWFLASLDLSGGYADAMSKGFFNPYNLSTVTILAGFLLCFLATAWLVATQLESRRIRCGFFLSCAVCAGLAWQHAIGGNQIEQGIGEIFVALWFLIAVSPMRPNAWKVSLQPATLALLTVFLGCQVVKGSGSSYLENIAKKLGEKSSALARVINGEFSAPQESWGLLMASIRKGVPIRTDLQGSADIYPQHTAVVIAHPQFQYTPRPAYLSLNAHTTTLAKRNAEYLKINGPEVVLFQVLHPSRSVDSRHPATADGPSWPELISRYELYDADNEFLILKKRAEPLPYRLAPLSLKRVGWGDELRLPRGQKLLWAEMRVKPSLLGRLLKPFYKAPHVILEQTLADGTETRHQIVPALGEAGFLLSPFVAETASFARLMQTSIVTQSRPSDRVISIRVKTEPKMEWFWSSSVQIDLFELEIRNDAPRLLPDRLASSLILRDLVHNAEKCMFPPSPKVVSGGTSPLYVFHAPCSTTIPVISDWHGVKLSYGLQYADHPNEPASNGAEIRVIGLGADGEPLKKVSRYLDPARRNDDRGQQQILLDWSPGSITQLRIEFDPGPGADAVYDHTYISDIQLLADAR
ncbi:hypothetical protein KBI52_25450 [Microvirga sp. HBU67558]|uniref:hypothetical protein n=1 Tax=Microvirga TaxID=186650 RepID=UPI001B38FF39|nr:MULTISPECIES: hypothetical protein [unclassified Microvirga]MBQ0823540.1 hypothetical protein [Microvirga sp. HBU67558]